METLFMRALERRDAAEEQMQLQAEACSKSMACVLSDAGHLPPQWLLPHRATAGSSEIWVTEDSRKRKQVASYSHSIACPLLAAAPRTPTWLVQSSTDVASQATRDVTEMALTGAAAAKRREEKKQKERELHKAAVELALERSKQEKERKQKQVKHEKKPGANFITRERQREGDGKRENDRKRKYAEEAPKHQKQLEEIIHSPNTVKDACPEDTDGKDLVENFVERAGNQLLSDERMESEFESNSVKAMHADCKSAGSGLQVHQENLSNNEYKSYGITPYKDSDAKDFKILEHTYEMTPYEYSDAKDFKILEHQREIRRGLKLIPSWAQEENLYKILVSNLALNTREVFAHKCCAIL